MFCCQPEWKSAEMKTCCNVPSIVWQHSCMRIFHYIQMTTDGFQIGHNYAWLEAELVPWEIPLHNSVFLLSISTVLKPSQALSHDLESHAVLVWSQSKIKKSSPMMGMCTYIHLVKQMGKSKHDCTGQFTFKYDSQCEHTSRCASAFNLCSHYYFF